MSGIDPKDSRKLKKLKELKAAAANFSSLPIDRKHLFVTALICRLDTYRMIYLSFSRQEKKRLIQWSSPYLNRKELEMIGDLYPEEANKSQEEHYMCIPFVARLERKKVEQLQMGPRLEFDKSASSYIEDEISVDTNGKNTPANVEKETRPKLNAKERKNMLANVESYRNKNESAMENWMMRKKTEFNQYLNMNELMTIGDLDPEEAKKSEKERYRCIPFVARLEPKKVEQLQMGLRLEEDEKYASSYNEESESDYDDEEKESESDYDDEEKERAILTGTMYQRKMERAMQTWMMKKKTEFNEYLNMNGLMMRWDLDPKEAIKSQKGGLRLEEDEKYASSYNEKKTTPKPNAKERKNMPNNIESYQKKIEWAMENRMRKTEFKQSNDGACSDTRHKLEAEERKNMLASVFTYRRKIMKNRMWKKTEFNQSDDDGACSETRFNQFVNGACSETKFNQSDDVKREEMLELYRKMMTGKKMARKEK